jgi:hypothetical protein
MVWGQPRKKTVRTYLKNNPKQNGPEGGSSGKCLPHTLKALCSNSSSTKKKKKSNVCHLNTLSVLKFNSSSIFYFSIRKSTNPDSSDTTG